MFDAGAAALLVGGLGRLQAAVMVFPLDPPDPLLPLELLEELLLLDPQALRDSAAAMPSVERETRVLRMQSRLSR
jgi:hypothetical protein